MRILPLLALTVVASAPLAAQNALVTTDVLPEGGRAAAVALRPGDAVRITVWRKPELSGDFAIAGDSTIASPFYMDLKVAGLPLPSAAERVRLHVARFETEPRVLVEPLLRVSVGGEVRQPSLYTLRPETTIAQAIMQAGGLTERGYLERVTLWRGGQELTVDLSRPDMGLAGSPILSGDQILVPRRVSIFRDYVAPMGSILGAAAAVANLILRRW
jgi:protein involved in polysaccharide export with SLBB domain